MRYQLLRWMPFILAGFLLLSLMTAIVDGGRGNWLIVALVALAVAANLWLRDRTTAAKGPPSR
jgi:hypothetical protein